MKRSPMLFALAICILFLMPAVLFAQRGSRSQGDVIEVRLASPLPRNSDWGRALDRLAGEWARVTNNQVLLRVLHDGIEGGDAKMLSSLSTDNIQAALFASFGLAEICPSIMTLSVPFLIGDDAELDLVLKDVLPVFEAQINRTNFAVLAWSKGGWVNIFSKDPVVVPDDLRRQKLATNPESVDLNTAFKTMGFQLVETETNDVGPKLASNMISAIYQTPAAIAPLMLQRSLGNMLEMPISLFMGAIVMNRVTWNKLGPERQRDITMVTQRVTDEFDTRMPRIAEDAIKAMQRDGLKVNTVSANQKELWRAEIVKVMPSLLGTTFDRDMYQRINTILERSRARR